MIETPSHILSLKMSENLRDFMISYFGETWNVDKKINAATDQRDITAFAVRNVLKHQDHTRTMQNKVNNNLKGEYLLETTIRRGVTPYQNKKINAILRDLFYKELFFSMAVSKEVTRKNKILEFINKYNLTHEEAYDRIHESINKLLLRKKKIK